MINQAYVQWAGITAGKKNSLYDFIGGGEAWYNLLSPDHSGTGVEMFAYTATFGGGFSATIDFEQPENVANYAYSDETYTNASTLGARSPDIIASLDVTQAWGMAHLAAVAHNVRMVDNSYGNTINTWGWGVIGGLGINLPSLGAGDVLKLQADYTHAAVSYSGFVTDGWGENNQGMNMNGNGSLYQFADAYYLVLQRLVAADHLGRRRRHSSCMFRRNSRSRRKSPTARSRGRIRAVRRKAAPIAGWAARC